MAFCFLYTSTQNQEGEMLDKTEICKYCHTHTSNRDGICDICKQRRQLKPRGKNDMSNLQNNFRRVQNRLRMSIMWI